MEESLRVYLDTLDEYRRILDVLLESTLDLTADRGAFVHIITDPQLLEAFRYLSGPPISEDELQVLADAVLAPSRLKRDAAMAMRVVDVVLDGLDRRRFPWVASGRRPDRAERDAAVLASAALLATRRIETMRRNSEKQRQEAVVMNALLHAGLERVESRGIPTLTRAPRPGHSAEGVVLVPGRPISWSASATVERLPSSARCRTPPRTQGSGSTGMRPRRPSTGMLSSALRKSSRPLSSAVSTSCAISGPPSAVDSTCSGRTTCRSSSLGFGRRTRRRRTRPLRWHPFPCSLTRYRKLLLFSRLRRGRRIRSPDRPARGSTSYSVGGTQ